jgi:hypothetical protein
MAANESKFTKVYEEEFVWRQETPETVALRANEAAALRAQSHANAAVVSEAVGTGDSSKRKKHSSRKSKKTSNLSAIDNGGK